MGTSIYFNNQRATQEQLLLEDLIIESIKNHGIDVYYMPRESQSSTDELFGDDPVKTYRSAIKLEMYLESVQGYEGNKEFFGKFGLEIQETARLCIARRTYEKLVTSRFPSTHHTPKEGDLIYLPIQYKLMEIKFVEDEKNFFQLGRDSKNPYMYGISMEAFKYNGELLQTGVDEIDRIGNIQAYATDLTLTADGTKTYTLYETVYQGSSLAAATAKAVVAGWNKPNRALKIRNVFGAFVANTNIIGASSGAIWSLASIPDLLTNSNYENIEDNSRIETEGVNVIDFSEINPFGEP
jgi:hypothetical protein